MNEILKLRCPTCQGQRNCSVRARYTHHWDHGELPYILSGTDTHHLLQCEGCETVFYYRESTDSENFEIDNDPATGAEYRYFPVTTETYPAETAVEIKPPFLEQALARDAVLYSILSEMHMCSVNDSYTLATIGLRTAIDRITFLLEIEENLRFDQKLSALLAEGYIGQTEHDSLSVIIHAGNAAAHRGWKPSKDQFTALLLTFHQFFPRALERGSTVMAIRDQIPRRNV